MNFIFKTTQIAPQTPLDNSVKSQDGDTWAHLKFNVNRVFCPYVFLLPIWTTIFIYLPFSFNVSFVDGAIYLIFFMVLPLYYLGRSWVGLSALNQLIILVFTMIDFYCFSKWELKPLILSSLGPFLVGVERSLKLVIICLFGEIQCIH